MSLIALLAALGAPGEPAGRAAPGALALVNARVLTVSGSSIEGATILIADGKIRAVGAKIEIPTDARRIDLAGKVVIPGLVDAHSSLFLSDAELAVGGAADRDVLDAADLYHPDADKVLAHGVTTLYLSPGRAGPIGGVGAVVKLAPPGGTGARAVVLKARSALKLSLGVSGGSRSASLERLGSYEALRAAFRGAQHYARTHERYEREMRVYEQQMKKFPQPPAPGAAPAEAAKEPPKEGAKEPPKEKPPAKPARPRRDPGQETLLAALRGEIPVRIEAHRADDLLNALRLADEFKLKAVLERATEGARVASEIARRGIPIVWGPALLSGSPRADTWNHDPMGAAALAKAGVRVILATGAETGLASRFLLENAAAAAGGGLDPDAALRAITLEAAAVLGVADRVGSIEPGKDADLVVLSAMPWSPTTRVEKVFVEGQVAYEAE